MFKKFTSAASVLLLISVALPVLNAGQASAVASTDATLNIGSSTIKGVSVPSHTPTNCIDCMGSPTTVQTTITLTSAQATGSASTSFVANDAGATVKVLKMASVTLPFTDLSFTNATAWNLSGTIYHNEIIMVRVTAADGITNRYYGWKVSSASNDATLASGQIKGVAVSSLGTPNATIGSVTAGAVTITADQGASTSLLTAFLMNVPSGFPMTRKKFSAGATPTSSDFNSAANWTTGALSDGDIVVIRVTAEDMSTSLYYKIVVTFGAAAPTPSVSSTVVNAAAEAAAAAAKHAAEVAAAKTTLVQAFKAGKPVTAADLNAADFNVTSAKAAERVATKVLALPEALRADLAKVQAIVRTENFVDKVSTQATQALVTSSDLIQEGLLNPDYKYKATIVRAIQSADPSALTSIEKVQAAVKAAEATIQARKDRLAAVIAKINANR